MTISLLRRYIPSALNSLLLFRLTRYSLIFLVWRFFIYSFIILSFSCSVRVSDDLVVDYEHDITQADYVNFASVVQNSNHTTQVRRIS